MPIRFKVDVMEALKKAGYTANRIRNEKLIGEGMLQKMRKGDIPSWHILGRICYMLNVQPGDLLIYDYDEADLQNDVSRSNSSGKRNQRLKISTPIDDATSDMESRAAEVLAAVDGEAGDSTDNIGTPINDIGTPMSDDEKSSGDGDALPWAEDDIPVKRGESWDDMVARHMKDVPPSMDR